MEEPQGQIQLKQIDSHTNLQKWSLQPPSPHSPLSSPNDLTNEEEAIMRAWKPGKPHLLCLWAFNIPLDRLLCRSFSDFFFTFTG